MSVDCTQRRVVITGMGVISPSGHDLAHFWENVRGGVSAAAPIGRFDASKLPVKVGAEVKNFDIGRFASAKQFGHYELTVQFGVAAASLAVRDSGIELGEAGPGPDERGGGNDHQRGGQRDQPAGQFPFGQTQLPRAPSLRCGGGVLRRRQQHHRPAPGNPRQRGDVLFGLRFRQ